MKYLTLIIALFFIFVFFSCRDYITDVIDNTPPEIATNETVYTAGDTVLVTFKNLSSSTIYVTSAYNILEKKNSSVWEVYSIYSCSGGCPEFPVYGKSSIYERFADINTQGFYRFVTAYSTIAGESYEKKNKAYSNEFFVQVR